MFYRRCDDGENLHNLFKVLYKSLYDIMDGLTYIDLFAGCGGLSLGLHQAGWKGQFAIEKSPMAFETLQHNLILKKHHFAWPEWLPQEAHDINEVLEKYRPQLRALRGKVDLVAGGPPCQGFSMAGRRNARDQRNKLVHAYIDFIDIVRPKVVFLENVKGFTIKFNQSKRSKPYSNVVLQALNRLGYDVEGRIIDFSDFGIPQRRHRFILVGVLRGDAQDFFTKVIAHKRLFLQSKGLEDKKYPVQEVLSDIERKRGERDSPDSKGFKAGTYALAGTAYQKLLRVEGTSEPDSHRFPNHGQETVKKFRYFQTFKRNKNLAPKAKLKFGLKKMCIMALDSQSISPTLTTLPDDYIHYSEPRILTVREYARIQTFPDWFEFKGKYTTGGDRRKKEVPRYTQIGNAIPPLFAEQAGMILKEMAQ